MNKKIVNTVKNVATAVIIVCAVFVVCVTMLSLVMGRGGFLGYNMYVALSDSMSKTHFDSGDIVITRPVDPTTLEVGDVITFVSNKDGKPVTVTHKIREKTLTERGEYAFVTYGTTTGADDEKPVTYGDVLGKYTGKIPYLGHLVQFIKSRVGFALVIILPLLLITASSIFNVIAQIKQKDE